MKKVLIAQKEDWSLYHLDGALESSGWVKFWFHSSKRKTKYNKCRKAHLSFDGTRLAYNSTMFGVGHCLPGSITWAHQKIENYLAGLAAHKRDMERTG